MTLFLWARPIRPRSHSPKPVSLADRDGKAARAPWIRSVQRSVLPTFVILPMISVSPDW